jgi:hypothetical protein
MHSYRSKSGKPSGVIGYEIGKDFILVEFTNREVYKYSYEMADKDVVERMKVLALNSLGLSTFISKNNPPYDPKD